MNLPAFHLIREGSYYFLSVDRAYGYTQAHAKALHNALVHIDYTDIKDVSLKAAIMKGNDNKSVGIMSQEDKAQKISNPDGKGQKIKGQYDLKGREEKIQCKSVEGLEIGEHQVSHVKGEEVTCDHSPEVQGQIFYHEEVKDDKRDDVEDGEGQGEHIEGHKMEAEMVKIELHKNGDKCQDGEDPHNEPRDTDREMTAQEDEALHDDPKDHIELIKRDSLSTEKETETFRAEDITISVTRPSPVKELPRTEGAMPDLFVKDHDGEQSGEPREKDYFSDKSSGSSIQVLDDKGEAEEIVGTKDEENISSESVAKILARDYSVESIESEISKPGDDVFDRLNKSETSSESHVKSRHTSDHSSRHSSGGRSHGVMSPIVKTDGSRGLSPLTVMGMEAERKGIRRAHSSASFEKYKHEKTKLSGKSSNPQTPGQSGWSTPQRRSSGNRTPSRSQQHSGNQTPSRSRHHSGLEISTPMSTIETSSRCSVGDDG